MPKGFTIETIASIGGARELAALPNGDLIVGTSGSDVYIVPDAEGAAGNAAGLRDDRRFDSPRASRSPPRAARSTSATVNHVWRIPYHGEAQGEREFTKSPTSEPDPRRREPTATFTRRRR